MNALGGVSIRQAAQIAAEHADRVDQEGRFPTEALGALKTHRFLSIMLPRDLGGDGATISTIASHCNQLARACASTAMIYAMHQIQVACLVEHALDMPWQRDFARQVAQDQFLIASATSEIGIGGNLRASQCAVTETSPDTWRLEKRSPTMSYGAYADAYLISARRHPDAPPSDQVLVTALRTQTELTRTGGWNGMGLRGSCSEAFDIHAHGQMPQVIDTPFNDIASQTMLPVSHLLWAAVWLGISGEAVTRARACLRAQARRTPGTPPPGAGRLAHAVGLVRMVQARVQMVLTRYEATRANPQSAGAWSTDADLNALKHTGSQMCLQAVEEALRICGMAGYRNDGPYSLSRHLRDMWSAPLMIGNDRIAANTGALLLAERTELGAI